jgi:nitroreductase
MAPSPAAPPDGFDLATVDRLLSTTRAVRRRLDLERPVPPAIIHDCIRLSQQAPTASNSQGWRWVVVTDPETRKRVGEIYGRFLGVIQEHAKLAARDAQTRRVYEGAMWLAQHMGEVPVQVLPCVIGRPPERFQAGACAALYGSILQAVWSFQLALRSRGLGSAFTTIHLGYEEEMRALLGIPDDVLQVALLPVAWTKGGDFRPARRPPVESITFWNRWGEGLS